MARGGPQTWHDVLRNKFFRGGSLGRCGRYFGLTVLVRLRQLS